MSVSRETKSVFLENYCSLLNSHSVTFFDDLSFLPVLARAYYGSCLVVEDSSFGVVFDVLYRSSLSCFSALSNMNSDAPYGFLSPLQVACNAFSLNEGDLSSALVLVNESYLNGGKAKVSTKDAFCVLGQKSSQEDVYSDIVSSGLERVSVVVSPGTYAKRGSVCDVFPVDSKHPVRVDFSFEDDVRLYVFDVSSQASLREISSFRFKVSSSGFSDVRVSDLLGDVPRVSVGLGHLGNPLSEKKIIISSCNYETYKNSLGLSSFVDPLLESGGVVLNGCCYVPPWFLKGKNVGSSPQAPSSMSLGDFSSVEIGDYFIHEDFGVGVFVGIVCDENDNDQFVSLKYADGFVSVGLNNLSVISYYESASAEIPLNSISKKGVWKRRVNRVSNQINHFVEGLLLKHAERVSLVKNRPPIDEELLLDFLSSFKHKDTKDQALAFNDILLDLKSSEPMDRLLCGDVGFGKAEIAIRAAFLSILMGGKVVVLAPTTILCHQLFRSFSDRLNSFSVKTAMVSRLVSEKEASSSVNSFNLGLVDVLVCTQRVFSFVEKIHSFDLLIIDEEHRFGVKQKEVFLNLFSKADVLSMSATPIPRSLQQAFSGIKTISSITTPPVNRRPIQTSVVFFDLKKIVQIILVEVQRGGQVYFLHNNIASLNKFRRLLLEKIPKLRVSVVHGKMKPVEIENNMADFVSGEYDVLVSTSIIESGLDIPNVNTVIINNAHLFGLSQLHQIRGRVGRHDRQAFAYLLIPRSLKLNSRSKKRLKAIEENVSLGSGYNIASKDLDIRGAGSVFGYAQSGGSSVGFELYNKLLASCFSKKDFSSSFDPTVDIFSPSPCFPSHYIKEEVLRLSLYKSLSGCKTKKHIDVFQKSLIDRFGVLPSEVLHLLKTQQLKVLAQKSMVSSIFKSGSSFSLLFLPGEHVSDSTSFLFFLDSFFNKRNLSFSVNQKSGNRLVVSFVCLDCDIYEVLIDLLNKFISMFLKES